MKPRDIFLAKMQRKEAPRPGVGSATSVVTTDLMERMGIFFPEAHTDAEKMAGLAEAAFTELELDNCMPLFSVWHESAALGCQVDWGNKYRMPDCRQPLCATIHEEIDIPGDLLQRPPCAVPLQAIKLLRRRIGDEAAILGKVFGPWTLGYHLFGVEEFLINTILDPDAVKRAIKRLLEVTVTFGRAQIEAGAHALTLADHATKDLCSAAAYRDLLQEVHQELKARLNCPIVLHICGDTSDRISYIAETGIDCFHFDAKANPQTVRRLAAGKIALMGGTSNFTVVRGGTPEAIARDVQEKLALGIDIIGPECAVPLDAPYKNIRAIAQLIKHDVVPNEGSK